MSAGAYRIVIGDVFYIGSSKDLRRRRFDHQWRLRSGNHPVKKLRDAYKVHGDFRWVVTDYLQREEGESDDSLRTRLRALEQKRLTESANHEGLANVSLNSRGPEMREDVKQRWQDPEFRAYMARLHKERLSKGISPETRERMAVSKRGARNHNARAVEVTTPEGETLRFGCASDAAKFFGVKQQVFDLWIRGVVPWPSWRSREKYRWIGAYSARYADEYVI